MTSLSSKEGGGAAGDGQPVVELVVKSANQSFDDLIVQCENICSIGKLKERITEQYPCKLLIEDQKLIYSGKLLTDDLILKDILRCFEDPEVNKHQKHIFHLVYSSKTKQHVPTPASKSPTSATTSSESTTTDGLRQRNVQQTNEPAVTATNSSNAANMFNFPGGPAGPQYFMAQQMAMHTWMQQVYWQYMNQYMNSTNTSENRPQGQQFIPQNFIPQMPAMPYFPAANFPQPALASPQTPQPEPQPQVAAPAQAQPRFPNIVQEEQENRDWLDIFYLGCRLMLFLTLIYFYSSATRCILVIGGAIGIYLYHNGYFRNQNPAEANNNNVNNNNRNVDDDDERVQEGDQQDPVEVEAVPEAAATEPRTERRAPEATVPAAQNPGTSVMSIIKTFVITFITSLLPDTQTL